MPVQEMNLMNKANAYTAKHTHSTAHMMNSTIGETHPCMSKNIITTERIMMAMIICLVANMNLI